MSGKKAGNWTLLNWQCSHLNGNWFRAEIFNISSYCIQSGRWFDGTTHHVFVFGALFLPGNSSAQEFPFLPETSLRPQYEDPSESKVNWWIRIPRFFGSFLGSVKRGNPPGGNAPGLGVDQEQVWSGTGAQLKRWQQGGRDVGRFEITSFEWFPTFDCC